SLLADTMHVSGYTVQPAIFKLLLKKVSKVLHTSSPKNAGIALPPCRAQQLSGPPAPLTTSMDLRALFYSTSAPGLLHSCGSLRYLRIKKCRTFEHDVIVLLTQRFAWRYTVHA